MITLAMVALAMTALAMTALAMSLAVSVVAVLGAVLSVVVFFGSSIRGDVIRGIGIVISHSYTTVSLYQW